MDKYKLRFDEEDSRWFFKCFNPLGLRDDKGQWSFFLRYHECYLEFLNRIYFAYAAGYIDPVLLLVDMYGFNYAQSVTIINIWRNRRLVTHKDPYLIVWERVPYTVEVLTGLIHGVSYFTDAPVKLQSINLAFDKFFEIKRHE